MGNGDNRLLALIKRIERLEKERRALASDIKDIYAEGKDAGFEVKAMRQLVKERREDPATRAEFEELMELYRAAIGALRGTPLGDAARRRLLRRDDSPPEDAAPGGEGGSAADAAPAEAPPPSAEDLLRARAEGAAAAKAGKMVLVNPYPALSAQRAAWDEGWCAAAGGDGMDIPTAFRRVKKPKGDGTAKGH